MTISRDPEGEVYFECDGRRCAEVCVTECTEFESALIIMKEEGWTVRKIGNDWKHYCPDEDDDSEIFE